MKKQKFLIIIPVFFIFLIVPADAGKGTIIERMELSELNKMIKAEDNHFLIVVMAAWCGPCIRELPDLVSLYKKYKKHDLKLIAICLDLGGPDDMQPFIDKYKVNFPVYWVGDKAVKKLDIFKIPMLMIVENGKISEKITGKRSKKYLEKRIKEFIKQEKN